MPDLCGCCLVCARGLGQRCDPEGVSTKHYGTCGEFLTCQKRTDVGVSKREKNFNHLLVVLVHLYVCVYLCLDSVLTYTWQTVKTYRQTQFLLLSTDELYGGAEGALPDVG